MRRVSAAKTVQAIVDKLEELAREQLFYQYLSLRRAIEYCLVTGVIPKRASPKQSRLDELDRLALRNYCNAGFKHEVSHLERSLETDSGLTRLNFLSSAYRVFAIEQLALLFAIRSKALTKLREQLSSVREHLLAEVLIDYQGATPESYRLAYRQAFDDKVASFAREGSKRPVNDTILRQLARVALWENWLPSESNTEGVKASLLDELRDGACRDQSYLWDFTFEGRLGAGYNRSPRLPEIEKLRCLGIKNAWAAGISLEDEGWFECALIGRQQRDAYRFLGDISMGLLRWENDLTPGFMQLGTPSLNSLLRDGYASDKEVTSCQKTLRDNVVNALLVGFKPEQIGLGERERRLLLFAQG